MTLALTSASSSGSGSGSKSEAGTRRVGKSPSDAGAIASDSEGVATPSAYSTENTRSYGYMLKSGLAGGLAGCAAKSIIAPLDRVKILFQTSSPQFAKFSGKRLGIWRAAREIYLTDGVLGLFQGHSATLLRIFPYAAIKFVAYEQIRSVLISSADQETSIRRMLSGSLAGVSSVFFTYPLELIRVRLAYETRRDQRASFVRICKQIYYEGPLARPSKSSTTSTSSALNSSSSSPSATASSSSALSSSSTRASTTSTATASESAETVVRAGRISNFYRGFSPTVLGMLPYAGVSFLSHDKIHDIFRSSLLAKYAVTNGEQATDRSVPLRTWAQLVAGGLAGMIAQTASYPLEVIRRRMQVSGAVKNSQAVGIGSTARLIFQQHGARGFFVGLTIGYIKVIPMASCSFFVYERMKHVLGI
ncbi:mitochondrial carrier domain-containing protein [Myxozyma melibiosi]|uniref:Mitochondrial carrier domain-containing protein n=1 Tax=Myxozyma melibiosi TaxID=54550 RepID=A0ABR1FA50_9ASCO